MLRLVAKGRTWPQLFAVATAAATIYGNRLVFASKTEFCSSTNPLSGKGQRTMASSTTSSAGKDEQDSILVGALRKAGITKSPKDVTDEEWARILTPNQYAILRESQTERPYTGEYLENKEKGTYYCAACGASLFKSETKFDSHCGWPSFYDSAKVADDDGTNVGRRPDNSHGMIRTEIFCKKCGSHLGHVFDDGPDPTGERHCVNSASIEFVKSAVTKK